MQDNDIYLDALGEKKIYMDALLEDGGEYLTRPFGVGNHKVNLRYFLVLEMRRFFYASENSRELRSDDCRLFNLWFYLSRGVPNSVLGFIPKEFLGTPIQESLETPTQESLETPIQPAVKVAPFSSLGTGTAVVFDSGDTVHTGGQLQANHLEPRSSGTVRVFGMRTEKVQQMKEVLSAYGKIIVETRKFEEQMLDAKKLQNSTPTNSSDGTVSPNPFGVKSISIPVQLSCEDQRKLRAKIRTDLNCRIRHLKGYKKYFSHLELESCDGGVWKLFERRRV